MTRSLLQIGAGPLEVPVIRWAHEAGLRVVATDPDPDAAGRREADAFHCMAEEDLAKHRALIEGERSTSWIAAHSLRASALGCLVQLNARLPDRAGEFPSKNGALEWETGFSMERMFDSLRAQGLDATSSDGGPVPAGARLLEVNAYLRDGDFVPAGIAEIFCDADRRSALLPAALTSAEERAVLQTLERAVRHLGWTRDPIGAQLLLHPGRSVATIRRLVPMFSAASAVALAPLALGKSPIQAWFGTLQEVGGPFDAMPAIRPTLPLALSTAGNGARGESIEEPEYPIAGWRCVPAPRVQPGPRFHHTGFADREGRTGALLLPPGSPIDLGAPRADDAHWLFSSCSTDAEDIELAFARVLRSEPVASALRIVS